MPLLTNIATTACAQLETRTRHDGTRYIAAIFDAEPWIQGLCRAAHADGAMLPDDFRYEMIRDALAYISECDEEIEFPEDHAEMFTEYYGTDTPLYEWLASHHMRRMYCDLAIDELCDGASMHLRVEVGKNYELREVFTQVWAFLTNMIEKG